MAGVVYTVLRASQEYQVEHVERLRQQMHGVPVVTLSDVPVLNRVPLKSNWPGWWSKMELFDPSIPGDVFYMDLDTTVLTDDIRPYMQRIRTTLLSDFYRPTMLQSSLMFLTAADRADIWARWIKDPAGHMKRFARERAGFNGDQNFIDETLVGPVNRWQNQFPGKVQSYKVDVLQKRFTVKPDIVIFHGKPRPWQVPGFGR